ncbi:MAG: exodeoxyribonuclease V subunit gamma [Deltaproteobacteria bacterium]|nr:exodeoxyribonuclease V subunit gamma [Deltaproteobacteria bacterium]
MTKFRLFTSNRLEILAEALSEVLRTPLASPLDEEIIVIQSKGMERWVSTELARHHGICANIRFPFPNAFVYEVFGKVIQDLPERSPFDPKIMTWKIMGLLPSCVRLPGFDSLGGYLGDAVGHLKLFQVSERIADTFDQYLLFRPETILGWERNKEDHWQAVLWRELVKEDEKGHRAGLGKAFLEAVEKSSTEIKGLPERISVFGISALPRFHMQIFAALSRFTQVNLFLMNPCREYWGDIVSDREMKRTLDRERTQDVTPEELHLEKGNSLLASMGALGRDFFDLVNEFNSEEISSFQEPGEDNLLLCIQSDILNLRDRDQGSDGKKLVAQDDTSIRIHSCHSPMREIEVLHDRLLEMFEKDPSLLPRDVLVMTPDIETYCPYVQAVFDVPANDPRRIPFSIADRSVRKESQIIGTFLSILDLCGSRFGAPQVLAILESRAVQRKFGLSEADFELIRKWVNDTRIRWGIDEKSRSELDLPPFPENTWKAGLERLLLGYAMPGHDENMFGGVLPYDHVEGSEASVLGKFLEFADRLFADVTSLDQPRTLNEWSKTLTELLEGLFLADEDTESETLLIRRTLEDLGDTKEISGFDEEIDIRVIKSHLGSYLEKEGFGFGFIAGGVTFCAMLPMRSIPFKVICLVGMNGDAYPRQSKPLGFDLMAKNPKPGDRSRRHDDRYLFLEAILSAREKLYISYVGQSIQDNTLIPPSVLVSELMDYTEEGFKIEGEKILDHIITKHRLQAFSPKYFKKNKKLFTYSEANCQAAECILKTRQAPVPFISKGLSDPEQEWKTVDLDRLCSFFGNPAKFLLNRRLGIYLEERASILEERETFDVKGLEKYLLEQTLVERKFLGRELEDFLPVAKASGGLPHGTIGECIYDSLSHGVKRFVEMTEPNMQGTKLEPLEIDLSISRFRVTGRIDAIYPERLIQYRYANVKPKDRLKVWIHHLALNCLKVDDYPRTSMLVGLRPTGPEPVWIAWEYSPVEDSEEILGKLLEKYWEGLIRPVHFFPKSSWEYAQMVLERNKSEEEALLKARTTWAGSDYHRGECEDAYYQLCFGNTDPLDSEFQQIGIRT